MHRGAFEQAFVGFSVVCDFMWRSAVRKFQSYLSDLLDQTLGAIGDGEFLATRRSAGVPYLIQAIVSTEPGVSVAKGAVASTNLVRAMNVLFAAAERREGAGAFDGRVHACNILRALYRNNQLGEAIAPFVEKGVAVAINGFKSSQWGVRDRQKK